MELKKTTILSAFVVVAGIISEIMFRDVLSKSISGVVIGLVLIVITLVAFYFTIDGLYTLWDRERDQSKKHQKEFEQRLYTILNEQLKFQKIIYNEVHHLTQSGTTSKREGLFDPSPIISNVQPAISEEEIERIVNAVNEYTAKLTKNIEGMMIDLSDQTAETTKRMEDAVTEINGHIADVAQEIGDAVSSGNTETVPESASGDNRFGGAEQVVAEVNAHTAEVVQNLENQMAGMNGQTVEAVQNLESQMAGMSSQTAEAVQNLESQMAGMNSQTAEVVQDLGNQVADISNQTTEAVLQLESKVNAMNTQTMEAVQDLKDIVTLFQLSGDLPAETISTPDMSSVIAQINDHTMHAAKVVAKYIGKTSDEIKKKLDENQQGILDVVGS